MLKPRSLACSLVFTALVTSVLPAGYAQVAATSTTAAPVAKERSLIHLLRSDAALADKALACKQLAICGTKKAVPALARLLPDQRLSSWARIALEAIPGPAPDAALRKAMGKLHGKLLIGTINSIAVRRDVKAINALVKRLHDPDADVASAAAAALGRIGGLKAANALEPALASAPDGLRPAVAEACILCAEGFLAQTNLDQAATLYDAVRNANVPKQEVLEATRGAILARQSAGLGLLLEQLRSPDKALFGIGLRTARELPGREVTDALAAELNRCQSERQGYLLLAIADRDDAGVFPVILGAARTGPPRLRLVAVGALDRLGNSAGLPVLLDAATSNDRDLAQAALAALARLPGNQDDAGLLARLPQSAGKTREVLIEVATQRRIDQALPAILPFAEDDDVGVRRAAVQAIGELGDGKQAAGLVHLLQKTSDPKERLGMADALTAIAGRAGAACARDLLPLAQSADSALRTIGLHLLASAGGPDALAALVAAVEDKDETVQDEAVRTLSTWPNNWPEDDAVADPLLALARSGKKPSCQVLGLRGYLQYLQGDKRLKDNEKATKVNALLPLITRPEEQRLAIAVVGAIPTPNALALLMTLAAEPAVTEDACSAIVAWPGEKTAALSGAQRREALQLVIAKSKNDATKAKAQKLLNPLP